MRLWPAMLVLIACGGDKANDTALEVPTFTQIRDDLMLDSCGLVGCHAPDPATDVGSAGGLTIDPEAPEEVYGNLVNATGVSNLTLVIPGDADGSYLIHKLEDAPTIDGDPMPPPFGLSADEEINPARIRAWIDSGAPNN